MFYDKKYFKIYANIEQISFVTVAYATDLFHLLLIELLFEI